MRMPFQICIFALMEDFIKRNIDMIGQMLLALAEKLGLTTGLVPDYTLQSVQDEINMSDVDMNIDEILSQEYPVAYMVEKLEISNEALETFVQIIMHSDAAQEKKQTVLRDAIAYMDSTGYYSFTLHSY